MKSDRNPIIFLAVFIADIVIFKVSLMVGWSETAGLVTGIFSLGYGSFLMVALCLWIAISTRRFQTIEAGGESILIVAPHQDDGVAMAGGFAVQTIERGGRVDLLYITDGPAEDKRTRRVEAIDAWSHGGLSESAIRFLPFDTGTAFIRPGEIEDGIRRVGDILREIRPEILFVPLYEGGHYEHDVINYIVRCALRETKMEPIRVYEAPLYNFRYSLKATPEKMLSGMARLIPGFRYSYPPEPVRESEFIKLRMTPAQLELKREMLDRFRTQNPHQLVERFGFEDRYQPLHDYDYTRPPFDYSRSLARCFNWWKRIPVVGRVVSRWFKWTRTIHPDPSYTMTQIPLGAEAKRMTSLQSKGR